ncbi:MAG: hypothetical protein Q7R65_04065 [bacterium]|nr:hypothetical protein [bacterium]
MAATAEEKLLAKQKVERAKKEIREAEEAWEAFYKPEHGFLIRHQGVASAVSMLGGLGIALAYFVIALHELRQTSFVDIYTNFLFLAIAICLFLSYFFIIRPLRNSQRVKKGWERRFAGARPIDANLLGFTEK